MAKLHFISFCLLLIISYTRGEEELPPQNQDKKTCAETCYYVDWAKYANCEHRNLTDIPQECYEAVFLYLQHNHIRSIPSGAFTAFQNLVSVQLDENGLTQIHPQAFEGNSELKYIYLTGNQLETIRSETFTGVPNLLQLYLQKNRIHKIEEGAFSGLPVLEKLSLSENNLTQIPGFLNELITLQFLSLAQNHLTNLDKYTFHNLENLQGLDLRNNKIVTIEADAFSGLKLLKVLDLYNNSISETSNFTFGIEKLDKLYLGLNPLKCDCHINIVRDWLLDHSDICADCATDATCGLPAHLQNQAVVTLTDISCEAIPTTPPTPPSTTWSETKSYEDTTQQTDIIGPAVVIFMYVLLYLFHFVMYITTW